LSARPEKDVLKTIPVVPWTRIDLTGICMEYLRARLAMNQSMIRKLKARYRRRDWRARAARRRTVMAAVRASREIGIELRLQVQARRAERSRGS
jgi:hypothetical protein